MTGAGARALICHPGEAARHVEFRAICPACGSFWDLDNLGAESRYTERYPSERSHFDAEIGAFKVATLERWLGDAGLAVGDRVVTEVGFGGGHCLARLHTIARRAFGIEAIGANLDHAATLGIPREALFLAQSLPPRLPEPVDLWLFQDAIEHVLDPDPFLSWLAQSSAPDARALVVAPDAASLSLRLLGRNWPHRVPDHAFHWSPRGMEALFLRHGFARARAFRPAKKVSTRMLALHLRQTRLGGMSRRLEWLVPSLALWFNLGELGLVFERRRG